MSLLKKPIIGLTCGRETAADWTPGGPKRRKNILFLDYTAAVEQAGGGDISPSFYGEKRTRGVKGIDPRRDACEAAVIREARKGGLPTLGICRGIQLLAAAFGGALYQDLPREKGTFLDHWQDTSRTAHSHEVRIAPKSLLHSILRKDSIPVNSRHHQAVKTLPHGFIPSASAEDGLVEALEDPGHPFLLAVQWHPEGTFGGDDFSRRIFEAFVLAARKGFP